MDLFVQQTPLILTDKIFEFYGGAISNSSQGQRQAAYTIAEMAAQDDLGTFLLPTIVTGTYLYRSELELQHTYIQRILLARLYAFDGSLQYTISGVNNWYLAVHNAEYGILDFGPFTHWCGYYFAPYKVDVVYEAGFPSGTTYTPNILLALTTYAQITLNEIIGYGNESSGDIGVQKFSNQQYTEERVKLMHTAFGSSPKGLFAHKLLTKFRRPTRVGMGQPIR